MRQSSTCVDAAFESFGIDGSIKEPRRDTQRPHLIASVPSSADLIALAIHVVGTVTTMNCALAKIGEKFEGQSQDIQSFGLTG